MIGENKLILNQETVGYIFERHLKENYFKDSNFVVSGIKKKYLDEWEVTLTGKENSEEQEA